MHPLLALALAGPIAALVSVPVAFAVFRLRGAYFAVGTWVFAEAFKVVVSLIQPLGGGSGMSLTPAIMRRIAPERAGRELIVYWVSLAVVVLVCTIVYLLLRSRHGLALTAIRTPSRRRRASASTRSVPSWRFTSDRRLHRPGRCLHLLGEAAPVAQAGFSVNDWTVVVIFMVVIGGIGTLEGPIIGVLVYFGLRELLADYGTWYLILLGGVAVAIMLTAQEGLWGRVTRRFDIHLFPLRRHLTR